MFLSADVIHVPTILNLFYLLASAIILVVYFTPAQHIRFLTYGARAASSHLNTLSSKAKSSIGQDDPRGLSHLQPPASQIIQILDLGASIRVPHAYFLHFYTLSTACSLIWLHQVTTRGYLFTLIANHTPYQPDPMTPPQVFFCWFLLLIQSTRRLLECLTLQKSSKSQMWIGHYVIGLAFYVAVNISIWIEGVQSLHVDGTIGFKDLISKQYTITTSQTNRLSLVHNVFSTVIFLLSTTLQYLTHSYLSHLRKYTLPTHPAFTHLRTLTPHYLAEVLIYISLTLLATPPGRMFNTSMLCATTFVIVNLGVSAGVTCKWTQENFGEESVRGMWRMIPGIW